MVDRHSSSPKTTNSTYTTSTHQPRVTFLRKLQEHSRISAQLMGFMTPLIAGAVLLALIGFTVTGTVMGLILFTPLIVLSSPIWIPVVTILFVFIAGFSSMCGFGVVVVAALSWIYGYYRGLHPPGSDRFDHTRRQIFDTAKDYAREYGGYLQSKTKEAAPGA